MSKTFLKVTGIGNLGRDPEMRFTPSGQPVTTMSVAFNREYNRGEDKVTETTWARVTAWGKLAEICNQYLHKGSCIYIEGRLVPDKSGNPRIWEKTDGTPGASFEITASEVRFLSSRGENGGDGGGESIPEGEGEEIPF